VEVAFGPQHHRIWAGLVGVEVANHEIIIFPWFNLIWSRCSKAAMEHKKLTRTLGVEMWGNPERIIIFIYIICILYIVYIDDIQIECKYMMI
jgi:hypothetical protein